MAVPQDFSRKYQVQQEKHMVKECGTMAAAVNVRNNHGDPSAYTAHSTWGLAFSFLKKKTDLITT